MRHRLLSLVNANLSALLISPLKLADLRLALVERLRMSEFDSVEQFVVDLFDFFAARFFFKLLDDAVLIEWSYRLKSLEKSLLL